MVWQTALTIALAASSPANDELWDQEREVLEPSGVTRQMFDTVMLWIEGQYLLGYCDGQWRSSSGVAHYRTWWDDSVLPLTTVGRELLNLGEQGYKDGLREGAIERPSAELCQRTIDSWTDDLQESMPAK